MAQLYTANEMLNFTAECVYRALNPKSEMNVPSSLYLTLDKYLTLFTKLDKPIDWKATPQNLIDKQEERNDMLVTTPDKPTDVTPDVSTQSTKAKEEK
jgi:hypothetical protein